MTLYGSTVMFLPETECTGKGVGPYGAPCVCLVGGAGRLAAAGHAPWRRTGSTPAAAAHLTC